MAKWDMPSEPADCLAALVQRRAECDELRAEVARLREAGDDVIRASNTLMLMLVGDLPMSKPALEGAIRRALDARNEWDNTVKDARAALTDGGRE